MTDVLSTVQVVMENVGYRTWVVVNTQTPTVGFEDEVTMGFICNFDNPKCVIEKWRETEAALLARYAIHFRSAGEKAWNVYCVFLTESHASEEEKRQVRWIEEDLERTRKLTATGVRLRDDVTNALLPLLPILSRPLLAPEDAKERLLRRVALIASHVGEIVLDESVSPAEVAARLRSGQ